MKRYIFIFLFFIILIFVLPVIFTRKTVASSSLNANSKNLGEETISKNNGSQIENIKDTKSENSNEKNETQKAGDSNAKSNQTRQFFCLRQPSHR